MKCRTIIFTFFILTCIGCIPSLHPIYDQNSRIIDDRIIGIWGDIDDPDNGQSPRFLQRVQWNFERRFYSTYRYKDHKKYEVHVDNFSIDTAMNNTLNLSEIDRKELPYYALKYKNYSTKKGVMPTKENLEVNLTNIDDNIYIDFYPYRDETSDPYEGIRLKSGYSLFDNMHVEHGDFAYNFIPAHTFAKVGFKGENMVLTYFDADKIEDLIRKNRVRLKHEIVDDAIVITASTEELRSFLKKYGNDEDLYGDVKILKKLKNV